VDASHQLAEEWPGEVRLAFHQRPLKMHKNALSASVASLAAHMQGKFWEYHDVLFKNQRALDRLSLIAYAQRLGLDMARFKKDLEDPVLIKRAQTESDVAAKLGARGTPAFLVNGRLSVGWGSWHGFRGQVLRELKQARQALADGVKLADLHATRAKANVKDDAAFQVYKASVITPLAKAKN
jgi:predicted DsbA family dithiol-disulfide isomerase